MGDIYVTETPLLDLDLSFECDGTTAIVDDWLDKMTRSAVTHLESTCNTLKPTENHESQVVSCASVDVNQNAIIEGEFVKSQQPQCNAVQELAPQHNLFDIRHFEQVSLLTTSFENFGQLSPTHFELGCYSQSVTTTRPIRRDARKHFKIHEVDILEAAFRKCQYPSYEAYDDLVLQLKSTFDRVRLWFKNRRAKQKKSQNIQRLQKPLTPSQLLSQSSYDLNLTEEQRDILEREFQLCPKPKYAKVESLALSHNLKYNTVRSWFTTRRAQQKAWEKQEDSVQSQMAPRDNTAFASSPQMDWESQMNFPTDEFEN